MRATLIQLVVAVLIWSPQLEAQTPAAKGQSGLSLAVGAGSGRLALTCDRCYAGRAASEAWVARLGYANSSRSIIGLEFNTWSRAFPGSTPGSLSSTHAVSWYHVTAQGYPMSAGILSGLYFKGGVGLADIRAGASGRPPSLRSQNIGWSVGAGYDVRLTRWVAVTPYFDMLVAQESEKKPQAYRFTIRQRAGVPTRFGASMYTFGVSFKVR